MKYLLTISILMALLSCNSTTKKQEGKGHYFEGFVEFNVTYEGKDIQFASFFKNLFGTRLITYLSADGFFAREYIDSNNIILMRQIYRPDSLKVYAFNSGSDTIFSSDVSINTNSSFVDITNQTTFKILDHPVDIINTRRLAFSNKEPSGYYVYTTYYNDIQYPVSPLIYKDYARNSVTEVFGRSPYLTTGYKVVYKNRMISTTIAKRIVPTDVPASHFEIPQNKIIIEKDQ